jgi:hypothetical protein
MALGSRSLVSFFLPSSILPSLEQNVDVELGDINSERGAEADAEAQAEDTEFLIMRSILLLASFLWV